MDKEQLLYRYFSNELTSEQIERFEDLLVTDPEFKKQFDFEKNLQKIIQDKETSALKERLIGFEKDISKERPVINLKTNYQKWTIAASVAVLIGLGWFGYTNFFGMDYSDLYAENFHQYPNTVYSITRGDTVASVERNAFAAYEGGNFQAAIDNFNKISGVDKEDYIDFYLGQSYLGVNSPKEAKNYFEKVIATESEFRAEAHWYLALIFIKEKHKTAAIDQLRILVSAYDFNKEKALALIEELE